MAKQIAYNRDCMEAMRQMPDKAFEKGSEISCNT